MSIFTNISNHSKRGYYALQLLFVTGTLTLGWSIVAFGDDAVLASLLGFCFGVNVLSIVILVYLQRTISARLARASVDEQEKARIMQTDALTGAVTRGRFLEELHRRLGRPLASRHATLVLVDIDHFKQLNDSFGHPFGDRVLSFVARSMTRLFPDDLVGRLGGDEFAILVGDGDMQATRARIDALFRQLRAGIAGDGQRVVVGVSVGAALAPLHATQSTDLMLLADLALYESKTAGRGRLTIIGRAHV